MYVLTCAHMCIYMLEHMCVEVRGQFWGVCSLPLPCQVELLRLSSRNLYMLSHLVSPVLPSLGTSKLLPLFISLPVTEQHTHDPLFPELKIQDQLRSWNEHCDFTTTRHSLRTVVNITCFICRRIIDQICRDKKWGGRWRGQKSRWIWGCLAGWERRIEREAVDSGKPAAGRLQREVEGEGILRLACLGWGWSLRGTKGCSVGHHHPQSLLSPVAVSKHPNPDWLTRVFCEGLSHIIWKNKQNRFFWASHPCDSSQWNCLAQPPVDWILLTSSAFFPSNLVCTSDLWIE